MYYDKPVMRRRRPKGRKIYSVIYLLDKQPKSLRKQKHYQLMVSYLQNSPGLTGLRFNRRCYSLLNEAVIRPEHLENFYRTYSLPENPFFPLFFMIKRNYLTERENKKLERSQYIALKMKNIPSYVQRYCSLIRQLEEKYSRTGKHPVFNQFLVVKTKKRADEYGNYNHTDWINFFGKYLDCLSGTYERIFSEKINTIYAYFILNCIPESFSGVPPIDKIQNRYRNYSKIYHPDRGGDHDMFIKIKWARDVLSV